MRLAAGQLECPRSERALVDKFLKYTGRAVLFVVSTAVVAISTTIITALMTGQPLSGFDRLKGVYAFVAQSTVPAWAFALVFVLAGFASYYAYKHSPWRRPKGKVHFLDDLCNTGWSKQHETEMNAQIGGTFTYEGPGGLIVLTAFLKGTEPKSFGLSLWNPSKGDRGASDGQLFLLHGDPVQAVLYLKLRPVLGTPGQPLHGEVILRDNFNRDFSIGPVDFPYAASR